MAGERTEQATPRRIEELRSKGQVARSAEVNTAAALLASFVILQSFGGEAAGRMYWLVQRHLGELSQADITPQILMGMAQDTTIFFLGVMAPLFLLLPVVGVLSSLVQVGPLIASKALAPDVNRINPLTGFQRLFGTHGLIELVKATLKAGLIGLLVYKTYTDNMPEILDLAAIGDLRAAAPQAAIIALRLGMTAAVAFLGLAALDYGYQRWEFQRNARMTRDELRDEMRQMEGRPEVRAAIRRRQRQMAAGRMMAAVPTATVVVTNPTHLAVALTYRAGEMAAPEVVAKGAGHVAERIKAIAAEHDVPVVENKPLAQALFRTVDIGAEIPAGLFQAVAEVLAYIYSLRARSAGRPPM
jgi:flagellar biosynthetic protein FlhB